MWEQRVAVGRRGGDCLRGDHRARARPVLDDHGLPERRLHRLAEQPGDEIDAAAGRVADQDVDRPARVAGLRPRRTGEQTRAGGRQKRASCQHRSFPLCGRDQGVPCADNWRRAT